MGGRWEYKGSAEALAALIAPLSSLSHLELADFVRYGPPDPGLPPSVPLPAALACVLKAASLPGYSPSPSMAYRSWDVAGLATCRGLTRLDANFSAQTIEPEMEQRLAQLR